MTVKECIARVYSQGGLPAFYKGISASYFGICETVVHFVIYESIKKRLVSVPWFSDDCMEKQTVICCYSSPFRFLTVIDWKTKWT